jgi:hypothetical protein
VNSSGFKTFICLKNDEGVECPICQKAEELFAKAREARSNGNEELSKTYFKEACSYNSKDSYIVRVIDRDHEEDGVKFWRFNKNKKGDGVYDKLMDLYNTRKQEFEEAGQENYNIFDLYNGKDIIISLTKQQISNGYGGTKEVVSMNFTDSAVQTPLSKDVEKANAWIGDTKKWSDVYGKKSPDYLEIILEGKVPFFDKEKGKFVEKKEFNVNQQIEEEKREAREEEKARKAAEKAAKKQRKN